MTRRLVTNVAGAFPPNSQQIKQSERGRTNGLGIDSNSNNILVNNR
jgi:hypothetical protein